MKSETYSDSDDDSNLVIVTTAKSNPTIKQELHNDDLNNLYSEDVIDNLWNNKAMGRHGPEEILVSLWYFVSHYFGISSRTDHAKLCLGNVIVENEEGLKKIVFKKCIDLSVKDAHVFTTRFPPRSISEDLDNKERCPVAILEEYLNRRPSNFNYPASPLYLQPDKSNLHDFEGPWYAAAGLGKNRIGALFNSALSRCGQPTIRHYNSRRQLIGDVSKSQSLPPIAKAVDSSPKIKLKICHLSSGNPIVTQSLSEENGSEVVKPKLRSVSRKKGITRKRLAGEIVDVKCEPSIDTNQEISSNHSAEEQEPADPEVKREKLNSSITKYHVKPSKRIWSTQKSIINITSKESNPITRQIMMQLSMTKDFLLPSDSKAAPSNNAVKSRLLRRTVKLSHMQLPTWPTIDKFCDSEMQRLMKYSFGDDSGQMDDLE